jgi:hypothetical protein
VTGVLPQLVPLQVAGDVAIPSPRALLGEDERREMLRLFQVHFEGVSESQFFDDLDAKEWVLRIVRDGTLVGFSTLEAYATTHRDRVINVIYSGDTVVSPEAWGSPVLARGWIALVRAIQATRPAEPWYWLLLSSGFRTYRFLPVFWREFWPRHDAEPDDDTRRMMAALAREHFDGCFDERAGVVRFPRPQRLRTHLAEVTQGKANDPHVRFFLERNPAHNEGDELVCLAELSDANLTAAGARMVRSSPR